ncbi:hypothetical protein HWI79_2015 [Cryptosporidium felis]|nr:hypothetical protein HWI79_2015 [Cryptosporidium felis]
MDFENKTEIHEFSDFEPKLRDYISDGEIEKNKVSWSEIGHIVHSGRKPQYSLSSILRRTNLFDEQDMDEEMNSKLNSFTENKIPNDKVFDAEGIRMFGRNKNMELMQVTDIIKNVHKEEVKIYLDEIASLRSQILKISKTQLGDKIFEDKEVGTNATSLFALEKFNPIHIKSNIRNKLKFNNIHRIEILPTLNAKTLEEKNEYIKELENVNIEIQKLLDLRNEQYSSVNLELVQQKDLFAKELESGRKDKKVITELENKIKYLVKKSSDSEVKSLMKEKSLNEEIDKLELEKKLISNFINRVLGYIINIIQDGSTLEINLSEFLENEQYSTLSQSCPNLLELIVAFDQIFLSLKEFVWKTRNIQLQDSITQTSNQNIKFKTEKILNIFIQSISNFQSQKSEDAPINSHYILNNTDRKEFLNNLNFERNYDFASSVANTRLRNEINILKNQMDASKQKLNLKELENRKLIEEISYLKSKIIRNKAYNSSIKSHNPDFNYFENAKLSNIKPNKLSISKNYYNNKYIDENWDEIFSVIQQLKDP